MTELHIQDIDRLFMPELDWLGVDIRGLRLDGVEHLWIWPYKPTPIGEGLGRNYGPISPQPPRGGMYQDGNSKRMTIPGRFLSQPELNGRSDAARVWIRIDISSADLGSVDFILLDTECLPGWESRPL